MFDLREPHRYNRRLRICSVVLGFLGKKTRLVVQLPSWKTVTKIGSRPMELPPHSHNRIKYIVIYYNMVGHTCDEPSSNRSFKFLFGCIIINCTSTTNNNILIITSGKKNRNHSNQRIIYLRITSITRRR